MILLLRYPSPGEQLSHVTKGPRAFDLWFPTLVNFCYRVLKMFSLPGLCGGFKRNMDIVLNLLRIVGVAER